MADHRAPARPASHVDRPDRLAQRADLVELDEHRVRRMLRDGPGDEPRIRHEQVVANELDPIAEASRERSPARPVCLGEPVLE